MDQREEPTTALRGSVEQRKADQLTAEQRWCSLRGFTRREWGRLVFMRWLYQQGRLTEYPAS